MKYYHNIKTVTYEDGSKFIFNAGYEINELPTNKPIWGFAYDINNDTEHNRLRCLPVLGEIDKDNKYFYPYKNGTTQRRKSGWVYFSSRMYADTYTEAVEMYNELVQKRIDELNRMIKVAEEDKIFIL